MNYAVDWTEPALDELAAVWLVASDRFVVTAASHRLEQDLVQDPYGRGVIRNSTVNRTAADRPLGIDYENVEDDKKARILRV